MSVTPGIDAQRWSEIRTVFDELVELEGARRRERLATIGASDPDLRRRVEALLSADAELPTGLVYIEAAFASSDHSGDPALDQDPLKLTGRTVSHFRIGEAIAAGGMGVVYRAEDTNLQRAIALKFPLPSRHYQRDAKERFLHEARSVAALDHPNICSIHEVGEMDDGRLFLAMPLYEGETLKARLAREGALATAEAISIASQVTEGVRAAHDAGIVHRDLKPANVMMLPDGTVKLLDFGVAKVRDITFTTSRVLIGTVSYMSPEQIRGQAVDGRADLWAIGVILYEMLTGRRPFEGEYDVSVAHAIVHTEPPRASALRPDIGPRTDKLIATLLRKDPAARQASADQLAAELSEIAGALPAHPLLPARTRWRGEHAVRPPLVIAAAVVLLALVVVSASLLNRNRAGADDPPRTVAVLPFRDVSGDTTGGYLSVSMGDAIALDLSRLHSLVVPRYARTSRYRDSAAPLSDIARELAASAVVHGVVRRVGDRILLDVQLVDSAKGERTWRRSYDRAAAEILDVQRDAVADLISALRLNVSDEERARLRRRPTTDARAYELYLRGRHAELRAATATTASERVDAIRLAQSHYSRAREVDPSFAMARARLALTYSNSALLGGHSEARLDQVRLEAEAALRLDPGLPEAHEALAWYWGPGKGDFARAATEMRLAVRGSPNNTDYQVTLAEAYRRQGQLEAALGELEPAMHIEQHSPLPAVLAAMSYSKLRRYEKAVKAWDRALELAPDRALYKIIRGHVILRWLGTADTLAAAAREIPWNVETDGMVTLSRLQVARVQRRWNDALTALNIALTKSTGDSLFYRPSSLMRAEVYEALGDRQRARSEYEAAHALLVDSVAARPNDERMRIALGLAYAGLGRKREAIAEARRAMELVPLTENNFSATAAMGGAVQVYSKVGETDAALELLELLLSMPAGREVSVPLLRVDPTYDPLRSDPRFEQLLRRFSNK